MAKMIAQTLFCPSFCGQCPNCLMLAHGTHPDYLLVTEPGQIKLEQAKELKAFLGARPNSAPRRVAVVENCQNLTVEAGNSLLRILEASPASSLCILTTDSEGAVLPTIVSRCQVYNLAPISQGVIEQALAERGVPEPQRWFLAGYSQGVLGRGLALLNTGDFWLKRRQIAQEVQEIFAGRRNPLLLTDNWYDDRELALDLLESWLRDVVFLQIAPEYIPVNKDLDGILKECVHNCAVNKGIKLLDQCVRARDLLHARCNPRLVFDSLALKMWEV